MSRGELYPWSTLQEVGDYFVVLHEFKTYDHMNATICVRNRNMRGRIKYACVKTTYGSIVMVAQVLDHLPTYEVEVVTGLYARTTHVGPSPETFGNRPPVRELTLPEKVARMSWEAKNANLPWWHDKGNLVWNGKVATPEDSARYVDKSFFPSSTFPYPDYYNLDENLVRREVEGPDEEAMEAEWGDFQESAREDSVGDDDRE